MWNIAVVNKWTWKKRKWMFLLFQISGVTDLFRYNSYSWNLEGEGRRWLWRGLFGGSAVGEE